MPSTVSAEQGAAKDPDPVQVCRFQKQLLFLVPDIDVNRREDASVSQLSVQVDSIFLSLNSFKDDLIHPAPSVNQGPPPWWGRVGIGK